MNPIDPTVDAIVARFDDNLREAWIERSAVREFDGGISRDLAEALALLDVIRMHPEQVIACLR